MLNVQRIVRSQLSGHILPVFNCPVLVVAHYLIPAPLSIAESKRKLMHRNPHSKRPDGDNLEKFLNDALNGILWSDDSRICWMIRSKTMTSDKVGKTVLYVKEMPEKEVDLEVILEDIKNNLEMSI